MRFALAVSVREGFSRQHLRSQGLARARKKVHAALRGCGKLGDGSFLAVGRWRIPRRRALGGGSGRLWEALEGSSGVLWEALGGCGRHWDDLGSSGRLWEALGGCGRHWDALGSSGGLWEALGGSGRLWEVLGSKQAQIGWSGDYRENRRSTDENSEHSELRPPPEIFRMFRIFVGEAAVHAAVAGPSALVGGARGKF